MNEHPSAELLLSATRGFDYLFCNDLDGAQKHFAGKDDPFHLLGQGVCAFMEAALGMESELLVEATRCLTLSEAGARRQQKAPKSRVNQRFPPGLEWEILNADAVVLLGLTSALSESYMGYLQCMYSLNSAHSKFTKLYKTVFPNGLDSYKTPAATPAPSRKPSVPSLRSVSTATTTTYTEVTETAVYTTPTKSFFARWTSSAATSTVSFQNPDEPMPPDGPVEEFIIAGTAFGFGLFNLVFSLLPKRVQSVVGFLGFKHDRKLALQALAVSATKNDVHSVFAGLVLMTYHGVVLLMSGYQADEQHILKQYRAIVDNIEARYPEGALWILNRAKILRMSHDAEGAIHVLRDGLRPDRKYTFAQADTLLVFELAWTLLGQRRYHEAAEMFIKITEINSWSHATYYFLAAGCYVSLGDTTRAQELLDAIPDLIDKRKINGKDLPTEVLIKKKLEFYKEKQKRRGGKEKEYAQAIKISIAEELAIFWNTHARIERRLALAHIREWSALSPPISTPPSSSTHSLPVPTPTTPSFPWSPRTPKGLSGFSRPGTPKDTHFAHSTSNIPLNGSVLGNPNNLPDLDTPDELALRSLLLGIAHRTAGDFDASRHFLKEACALNSSIAVSTWIGGVAMFELAVLELKVVEAKEREAAAVGSVGGLSGGGGLGAGLHDAVKRLTEWDRALKSAAKKLDAALALAPNSVDLSSRLDSRVSMLRDEIELKREKLGI
ncbi:Mitochondrial outer membrane protein IML2 [Hypsizygus marmoreus]|uniref:Mitochondrial outer membrane protein IML2 n=1 Tax=Hypsizygus marmoreus TaxID=39966 RepID=A0A369JLB0_HYPMA|nr:Mitochondrial outer membrane protein IML2 [Hypsizygus marmoreus]